MLRQPICTYQLLSLCDSSLTNLSNKALPTVLEIRHKLVVATRQPPLHMWYEATENSSTARVTRVRASKGF